MRAMTRVCVGALLGVVCALAGPARAQPDTYTFATVGGVGGVGGVALELDFYPALAGSGPSPVIVWIHGGGWRSGSRANTGPSLVFRQAGYAVASVSYRLTTQAGLYSPEPVVWPAQAHDVKAAVRWLRANASGLGVDPCAFIAWGSSAGGHLAAVLGTTNGDAFLEGTLGDHLGVSSDVQLAVSYFGPTDLLFMGLDVTDPPGTTVDHDAADSGVSLLLGSGVHGLSVGEIRANIGSDQEPWVSLVRLASSGSPAQAALDAASNAPMFIAHGTADDVVPVAQSVRLYDALRLAGTESEYLPVTGAGHGVLPGALFRLSSWLTAQRAALPACSCVADLAAPFGELTFADVSAFLAAFTSQDPAADLAGPAGEFTFADVGAFLGAFSAGCP